MDANESAGKGSTAAVPGSTSLSLLNGLKVEDQEAWRRFALLYGPLVYGWCRRTGLRAEDAEDLVQEVFVTVSARVTEFRRDRKGDTFRGWLRTITRHKLGDWMRRQKVRERAVGGERGDQVFADDMREFDDSADPFEALELYHRALDLIHAEFSEGNWQAFWGVVVDNRKPAEVAEELGMTRNAVYLAKSRILRRLREVLGDA
jgi:RNA polymerase sigma-70 factor (ECF subfamily)